MAWSSKKQPIVTLSTMEAEYVAAPHAKKEALWLHALTKEPTPPLTMLTILHCDNQSAIALSKDGQHHMQTKHDDIHFHFICKAVENESITLIYCPTGSMTVDLLTKPLNCSKMGGHVAGLGLLLA